MTPPTPGPTTECRVEGPNRGVVGLTVEAQTQGSFRFESWMTATNGDFIGFTLSGPTTVRYEVRAGDRRFWSESLTWQHPDLPSDTPSISRVDFCVSPDVDDD